MKTRKSTDGQLEDSIKQVQVSVIGSELLRLTHGFTGDSGRYGLVACFVVLPDSQVEELRGRLDTEIALFMEAKGYGLPKKGLPQ